VTFESQSQQVSSRGEIPNYRLWGCIWCIKARSNEMEN